MRNEIPENAVISETPKPNRSAALAIAIIAFIFSLYASIISTHNFYYVFFQKNARPEKADVASAVAMQNQRQLQSLQTAITALEKNQPQTEKTSGIGQSLFADIAAINMQIQMLSVLPKAPTVITKTEGTSSSWHAWMIDGLKQIKSLEGQLETMRIRIDSLSIKLNGEKRTLEQQRQTTEDTESFNNLVDAYNAEVQDYKNLLSSYNQMVSQHNDLVRQYQTIALEENQLIKALTSRSSSL